MTKEEEQELRAQLARLLQEHRDLDAAIAALQDALGADIIQVQRLKKRKLYPAGSDYLHRRPAHAGYYCVMSSALLAPGEA